MGDFLLTTQNILLPIFLQIALGFLIKKLTGFQIAPLVKLQFYLIIPALLFTSMYEMNLAGGLFWIIILHTLLLVTILYVLTLGAAKIFRFNPSLSSAMTNSVCLYNSGNFGIPLVLALFAANPLAISVQMIIMMVTSILTNTLGIWNASRGSKGSLKAMLDVFKVPMLFAILVAFALKGLSIGVWTPVWITLDSLGKALVPIALIALGAQLAETNLSFHWLKLLPTLLLRLLASPAIALGLVCLLNIQGIAAQVIVIAAAAPVAVNAVLISIQYNCEPKYSSEAVFASTVLSSVTVALVISAVEFLPL